MCAVYLSIFIISIILIYIRKKSLFSPLTIMAVCWCLFPAYASIGAGRLGLFSLSVETHIYILSSYFAFVAGYVLVLRTNKTELLSFSSRKQTNNNGSNYFLLLLGNLVVFVYLIPHLMTSIQVIQENGFAYLRVFSSSLFTTNTSERLFYNIFIHPILIASFSIISVDLLHRKNNRYKILIFVIAIVNVLLDAFVFAARATLVKVIVYFIFSLFFINRTRKDFKIGKTLLSVALILIPLLAVFYITSGRMSDSKYNDFTIIDNVSMYYVAPFGLLNHYVTHTEYSLINVDYTWGSASLGFIFNVFKYAEAILFGGKYSGTDYTIPLLTENYFSIGDNVTLNAACTADYIFLRDFGYFGLVFGFFIFGCLTVVIMNKAKQTNCVRHNAIYVFFLYCIFRLSMSYDFLSPSSLFALLYICIFTTKPFLKNRFTKKTIDANITIAQN